VLNVAPDGLTCEGGTRGGGYAAGRLMYRGIQPETAPGVALSRVLPQTDVKERLRGKWEETLPDVFELVGESRERKRVHLSVVLTADGHVMERDRLLAAWELDRRLSLKFVGPQLGEADLSLKSLMEMTGSSEAADGDDWKWTLKRVQLAAVWDAEQHGRLAVYSNGRLNGGDLATGEGFWSLQEGKFKFWHYVCTVGPDGKSFTGRGLHGSTATGKRFPNSVVLSAE